MASDPTSDPLFGLLALQNGLIDQGAIVAAFQAWTRDKARPLAEHLESRGDLDPDDRRAVEALVARHIKKHGGDPEKSLAALAVEPSIRESLGRIADPVIDATLAHVGSGWTDGDPDHTATYSVGTATYSVGTATADGQRFRVLRPHARGGLGAVFVALDCELNREVALKQILDTHADDPVSRQRFLLEAEITGGLEHPGIVPVYGLGTYDDGRPFYAMRFIRGDSLKDAIADFHRSDRLKRDPGARSLALRDLLRRFTDVCNAIGYAHDRGILHRDLKPGNVIVGKHGETLVVDWGLAKSVGGTEPGSATGESTLVPSSASGSAETLPGSTLGTPAYMSPEQARGDLDALGPRSDVYSLGATLYCLLTGKPPFHGGDVGAVLGAVQKGDFPAPRAVDPSIHPALEAVCLKAMATAPEGRFATPRALADDVERWAADEPVSARPEPFAERARRWMRRRRSTVTAAAAALVVATLGLASVLAVQAKANGNLKKANGLLTESVRRETKANADLAAANRQVQVRFDLALEAIKTFHSGVSEVVLLRNDNLKPVLDRLLKDAAEFSNRLAGQLSGQADRSSRRALGQAYSEMAGLSGKIGATEQAITGHRQALAVRRALVEGAEDDDEARAEVAHSLIDLGNVLKETGGTGEARSAYEEARTLLEDLAGSHPAVTQFQNDLALSHNNIGIMLKESGKPEEALALHKKVSAIWQRLADANPNSFHLQIGLVNSKLETGDVLRLSGQPAEARASYEGALAIIERMLKTQPALADFSQMYLVFGLKGLGATQQTAGQAADAVVSWRRAVASDERTRTSLIETLYYLAGCHARLGGIAGTAGSGVSVSESAAELDRAMDVLRRAVDAGYRNVNWMKRDPDLDSLRDRPDFRLLMLDLAYPADPFTR